MPDSARLPDNVMPHRCDENSPYHCNSWRILRNFARWHFHIPSRHVQDSNQVSPHLPSTLREGSEISVGVMSLHPDRYANFSSVQDVQDMFKFIESKVHRRNLGCSMAEVARHSDIIRHQVRSIACVLYQNATDLA